MPRGISRAKHPEAYGDKPSNVTKITGKKFGKGGRKLGTKTETKFQASHETIHNLSTHLLAVTTIINQLPSDADKSVLFDEVNDVVDVMVAERKKLYPNIEEPAAPAPTPPASVQATPPAFVPPPAPGIQTQPHA